MREKAKIERKRSGRLGARVSKVLGGVDSIVYENAGAFSEFPLKKNQFPDLCVKDMVEVGFQATEALPGDIDLLIARFRSSSSQLSARKQVTATDRV